MPDQLLPLDILLIEDDPHDAEVQLLVLKALGCNVTHTTSVVEGEDLAMLMLSGSSTQHVGIVTDLKLHDLILSRLEGSALAAVLMGRMLDGTIRKAPIVAITNDFTEERRIEALQAGCSLVLRKPLMFDDAGKIRDLVLNSPSELWSGDAASIQLLRRFVERVLADLRESRLPTVWTADDIDQILAALTYYRPNGFTADPYRQTMLLRALGGSQAARQLFQEFAASEGTNAPGSVMLMYLAGKHTSQIVAELEGTHGYAPKYVYRVARELSARIAQWMHGYIKPCSSLGKHGQQTGRKRGDYLPP